MSLSQDMVDIVKDHENRIAALEHERECTRAFGMALSKVAADNTVAADKPAPWVVSKTECHPNAWKVHRQGEFGDNAGCYFYPTEGQALAYATHCNGADAISPPADQPAGDDAADALCKIEFMAVAKSGTEKEFFLLPENAQAILAAIRRGEVPGIWCGALAESIASAQLIADLRAKLAAEEKTVDDALAEVERTEELFTEIAEMFDPDWEWSNLRTQSVAMDLIRDHLNAHDVVKAERDKALERVAFLEAGGKP